MGYKIQDKGALSSDDKARVLERLSDYHRTNDDRREQGLKPISANALTRELRASGVSYNRQNMLDDIRRTGVSYRALSIEGQGRAHKFYDSIIEPLRKQYGVSQQEAFKIWYRIREQDYEDLIEAQDFADIWDFYKGL